MPQRSHPAVSRDFPPSPATGEKTKLGHYLNLFPVDNRFAPIYGSPKRM
jgi:hypothetical protein